MCRIAIVLCLYEKSYFIIDCDSLNSLYSEDLFAIIGRVTKGFSRIEFRFSEWQFLTGDWQSKSFFKNHREKS